MLRESNPTSSQSEVAEWLFALDTAASLASQRCEEQSWSLSIAQTKADMRCYGPHIESWITPALGQALRPRDTGLARHSTQIIIWDQTSTGVAPPSPFWAEEGWANRGELTALSGEGVFASFHEHAGYLSVFDRDRRRLIVSIRDASNLPRYERAAPLRGPLSWVLGCDGAQFVHAAAVAIEGEAVLLAGAGGSGKSTAAVACMASGCEYLGDDYVVLTNGATHPHVHSLYSTAKLTEQSYDMLPALRTHAEGRGTADDKAPVFLTGSPFEARFTQSARVVAIALPQVRAAQDDSAWRPSTASRALAALAPTTVFQLPGAGSDALTRMAELARSVPVFELELGRDLVGVTEAVKAISSEARMQADAAS